MGLFMSTITRDWPDPTDLSGPPIPRALVIRRRITIEPMARQLFLEMAVYRSRAARESGSDPITTFSLPPLLGAAYDAFLADHTDLVDQVSKACDDYALSQPQLAGAEVV
jgi:hypothetical protein